MSALAPSPEIVCLVDDDASVLKAVGRLLTSEGIAIQSFNQPQDFLDYVAGHAVPLAVIDVWMAGMNGIEAQACLRKLSPRTRVIIMTGRDDPAVRANATDAGAVAIFIKPFDDNAFVGAVHRALGHKP
jgi:FixJ family two-component response regulator